MRKKPTKNDLENMKNLLKPPANIKLLISAICILFGVSTDWKSKHLLFSRPNLFQQFVEFDKEQIDRLMIERLKPIVEDPDFNFDVVCKCFKSAAPFVNWVDEMYKFGVNFNNITY